MCEKSQKTITICKIICLLCKQVNIGFADQFDSFKIIFEIIRGQGRLF